MAGKHHGEIRVTFFLWVEGHSLSLEVAEERESEVFSSWWDCDAVGYFGETVCGGYVLKQGKVELLRDDVRRGTPNTAANWWKAVSHLLGGSEEEPFYPFFWKTQETHVEFVLKRQRKQVQILTREVEFDRIDLHYKGKRKVHDTYEHRPDGSPRNKEASSSTFTPASVYEPTAFGLPIDQVAMSQGILNEGRRLKGLCERLYKRALACCNPADQWQMARLKAFKSYFPDNDQARHLDEIEARLRSL